MTAEPRLDATTISAAGHAGRIALVVAAAGLLLGWLAAHTDLFFADGLRYIAQAKALDRGSKADGLTSAVDHPAYPLAVVAVHRWIGGQTPDDWQEAAQFASIASALLLAVPLYLIAWELFGASASLPGCLVFYAAPLTGHVFADTLSESTFLLFWAWGLWAALRFLRRGGVGWLAGAVAGSGLAYLTRPEGLLLPLALGATLAARPVWVYRGLSRVRGAVAVVVLLIGSVAVVGPFVALKGGLATKPSVARLLGTAPRSAAHAVERQRPLDPKQSASKTYALAAKAVLKAVTESVTLPLLPFAALGLLGVRPRGASSRQWTLLAVIGFASVLALLRLHATGGYCSPRHAMILALLLLPAAGFGLGRTAATVAALAPGRGRKALAWGAAALALALTLAPRTLAPVNEGLGGYKEAGRWLAGRSGEPGRVVDVTGWSQFYGGRDGYTFENLISAPADPEARWVVVREAHLAGPWSYCKQLDALVQGLTPVHVFAGPIAGGVRPTRVLLFDRRPSLALAPRAADRR